MGCIAVFFGFLAAMPPIMTVVIANMTDKVNVATVVANEFIKAMVLRMVIWRVLRIPLMPFSDDPCGVSVLALDFSERRF